MEHVIFNDMAHKCNFISTLFSKQLKKNGGKQPLYETLSHLEIISNINGNLIPKPSKPKNSLVLRHLLHWAESSLIRALLYPARTQKSCPKQPVNITCMAASQLENSARTDICSIYKLSPWAWKLFLSN